ncbi:MAG: TIGR02710 family CRISPR-associated protein, partial [Anaerolineae bacterium]|nr:TIGR02710 family CRISPR-associated protein [Anaerolineae bacterium]
GLWEAYNLLAELDDPLGKAVKAQENCLRDALSRRNNSILAHGTSPIREEEYQRIHHIIVVSLIQEGLGTIGIQVDAPQFPELEPR